ncbi:MAG TPA: hypothetical protein VMY76_00685 [Gemmatimonadales bacterium]|nr:hypothetical protein [Gemmatimonadales bacterium]
MNVNADVWVRVSQAGVDAWSRHWHDLPEEFRPRTLRPGEVLRIQLWLLMKIFGSAFRLGAEPFEPSEIYFSEQEVGS